MTKEVQMDKFKFSFAGIGQVSFDASISNLAQMNVERGVASLDSGRGRNDINGQSQKRSRSSFEAHFEEVNGVVI